MVQTRWGQPWEGARGLDACMWEKGVSSKGLEVAWLGKRCRCQTRVSGLAEQDTEGGTDGGGPSVLC